MLGKPGSMFYEIVKNRHPEIDPWDVMMVGDRLETDIAFANRVGALDSVGVLTGIASEEAIRNAEGELAPQLYTDSLTDVKDILVFGEDLTNEDEEKQALEELEKLKEERREMRRKQREERRKRKENLEKEIEEGKKLIEEEFERMEKEKKQNEGNDSQN